MKKQQTSIEKAQLLVLFAVFVLAVFLKSYLGVIALSALAAFTLFPVYNWLHKGKLKLSSGLSISLTLALSVIAVLLPLAIVLGIATAQAIRLAGNLQDSAVALGDGNLTERLTTATQKVNEFIADKTNFENVLKPDEVQQFLTDAAPRVVQEAADLVVQIVSSVPGLIVMFILYMYLFTTFLAHYEQLFSFIRKLSPFSNKVNNLYFKRVAAMSKGMVIGQGVIAISQGLVGALSLLLLGLNEYFFILFLVLTIISLIPLGGGIITLPLGIIAIAFGNVWAGVAVIAIHFLVVTNIDNVLRPMLVPKDAKLPGALVLLAAFAGVGYFGFLGVIYGPIVMIVLISTLQMYVREKENLFKKST